MDKEAKNNKKHVNKKLIFKIIRIIFLWTPLVLISLIAIVLWALEFYLTPERVQDLIVTNFNELSYGTISLEVKDFSPYRGFQIEKILIRNGEEFNNTNFVEIDKLVVRYGLFSMLIGNIHIDEIGIYNPRIYLKEKKGAWNAARLMKPGGPGEEPPPEEEEEIEEGEPSNEINLPINVEFLFKFILQDLRLYVDGSTFDSSVEGITYNMDIYIPPFSTVPKSIEAVTLLKKMDFVLNPKGKIDILFSSKEAGIKTPLVLGWNLHFVKGEGTKSELVSKLRFGTYRAPVRFQRTHLAPLDFIVSYDLAYNPLKDRLLLSGLGISFKNKKWLNFSGTIKDVTSKQEIDLRMKESAIVLDDLYPYFVSLTGDRKTKFSGIISLYPLTIDGTPSYLDIDGVLKLKKIYFKNPDAEASIPSFKFAYSVKKRSGNMKIRAGLAIPHLFYILDRDSSGDNGIKLDIDLYAENNFQRLLINNVALKLYSPVSKKSALKLALAGDVNLQPSTSGNIKITKFVFLKDPLVEMLPGSIGAGLVDAPISKPVYLTLGTNFSLGKKETRGKLGINIDVPDFQVKDLKITANAVFHNIKNTINLKNFSITNRNIGLNVNAGGTVDISTPPLADSDLRFSAKVHSPKMKPIYGPWELSGLFELKAFMKGDLKTGKAHGNILIDKLFVKNDESKLSVDDVNLDFPFEYLFKASGPGESRIAVNKDQVIDNEEFKEKENFHIKSIKAAHPGRDEQVEYMKEFAATMFFRNNAFELVKLKTYVLDGAVYGRDILFNMADMVSTGNLDNAEFRLILDVTNVDIGKLDDVDPSKKTRDAELSLNANFKGRGLDLNSNINWNGYINLYKVGENIANKLFKGLNDEKGKSKIGIAQYAVDYSLTIKGFNFNLDSDLAYATVNFKSTGIVGMAVGIENDQIKYERVSIIKLIQTL